LREDGLYHDKCLTVRHPRRCSRGSTGTHAKRRDFQFTGMLHRAGALFDETQFTVMRTRSLIQVFSVAEDHVVVRSST